ncbi:MAG TPA: 1,2-phenylacetyl-CoA epoxidase subunit PaaD [Virgibacillus sp.]|nr:1,2-phenylacetyl-CoA epoxidase subunit PaaD [Virgibacillus sp.]
MQREEEIRVVLKTVDDPEIPSVSVYDLGMVHELKVIRHLVSVIMVPTFVGCPALDFIERDVKAAVEKIPWVDACQVEFTFRHQWSTDKITAKGRQELKKHGIAPPPKDYMPGEPWTVPCPYCASEYTSMDNMFGPTACRSILYCSACKNPFEAMKPVVKEAHAST